MNIRRAVPVLTTDDQDAARAFYETYLGFRVSMDEDGMLMLVSPSVPTTQIIIAWESPTAVDTAVMTVDVSVEVDDVDEAFDRARAGGWETVREIRDEPWGIRRFFLRDPTGRVINVASHIPPGV